MQYSIENLFAIRKTKFKDHVGVIAELDLVEPSDQITHTIYLDEEIDGEERLNIFKFDPFFEKTEDEWFIFVNFCIFLCFLGFFVFFKILIVFSKFFKENYFFPPYFFFLRSQIKKEILGEENIIKLKTMKPLEAEELENEEIDENKELEMEKILDFTEKDLINLRRTVYLTIMNSVDYEECIHKLMKMNISEGHEQEICNMLIECCMQERTYLRFYGLLAQRFAALIEIYRENFLKCFVEKYTKIHRYQTNQLRNIAKLFAHLLFTDTIDWKVLSCIQLTQEDTTSSSRILIKILFQEVNFYFYYFFSF